MLMSDWVYYRVPRFWLILGTGFLLLGLAAGPDFEYFLMRSLQVYQLRKAINRRRRMTVLTETQKIKRYEAEI